MMLAPTNFTSLSQMSHRNRGGCLLLKITITIFKKLVFTNLSLHFYISDTYTTSATGEGCMNYITLLMALVISYNLKSHEHLFL